MTSLVAPSMRIRQGLPIYGQWHTHFVLFRVRITLCRWFLDEKAYFDDLKKLKKKGFLVFLRVRGCGAKRGIYRGVRFSRATFKMTNTPWWRPQLATTKVCLPPGGLRKAQSSAFSTPMPCPPLHKFFTLIFFKSKCQKYRPGKLIYQGNQVEPKNSVIFVPGNLDELRKISQQGSMDRHYGTNFKKEYRDSWTVKLVQILK